MAPTKEKTLYLPIKQIYFDQIIEGTKTEEYREVTGTTAGRYLVKTGKDLVLNPATTEEGKEYFIDDYNNGQFPFIAKQYKYLALAVGYAKDRDTATVEVKDITFQPGRIRGTGENRFTWWIATFHLGKVVELYRKQR